MLLVYILLYVGSPFFMFGGSTETKGSVFGVGTEPSFVTNVSATFTLRSPDQQGMLNAAGRPSGMYNYIYFTNWQNSRDIKICVDYSVIQIFTSYSHHIVSCPCYSSSIFFTFYLFFLSLKIT